jgi:hypothetical protein
LHLEHALLHVLAHVDVVLLANLDVRNEEVVEHLLHVANGGAGRGRERQHAKLARGGANVAQRGAVGVVTARAVRLVDDDERNGARIDDALGNVVVEHLRRHEEETARAPELLARATIDGAGHEGHLGVRHAHDGVAGLELLRNERARRRQKDDLGGGKPAEEVGHHDGGNEGLAARRGQNDQRVAQHCLAHNRVLIVATRHVDGVLERPTVFGIERPRRVVRRQWQLHKCAFFSTGENVHSRSFHCACAGARRRSSRRWSSGGCRTWCRGESIRAHCGHLR